MTKTLNQIIIFFKKLPDKKMVVALSLREVDNISLWVDFMYRGFSRKTKEVSMILLFNLPLYKSCPQILDFAIYAVTS
jgi:hypothetical protein